MLHSLAFTCAHVHAHAHRLIISFVRVYSCHSAQWHELNIVSNKIENKLTAPDIELVAVGNVLFALPTRSETRS